jgi:hypothetical protein
MVGRTLSYSYPSGLDYRISFDEEHVYFSVPRQLDGTRYIGVPYRQREVRPGMYMVHWMVPGRAGHVSLVFDIEQGKVDAAALMPGLFELFDRATLDEMYEGGENALWLEDPRS